MTEHIYRRKFILHFHFFSSIHYICKVFTLALLKVQFLMWLKKTQHIEQKNGFLWDFEIYSLFRIFSDQNFKRSGLAKSNKDSFLHLTQRAKSNDFNSLPFTLRWENKGRFERVLTMEDTKIDFVLFSDKFPFFHCLFVS
jgi:hypothetical protein